MGRPNLPSTIAYAASRTASAAWWRQVLRLAAIISLLPVCPRAQPQDDSWAKDIQALIERGSVQDARIQFARQELGRRESYPGLVVEARLLLAEQHFADSMNVLAR